MNWKQLTYTTPGLLLSLCWLTQETLAIKFTPPQTLSLAEADLTSLPPPVILEPESATTIGELSPVNVPRWEKNPPSKSVKLGKKPKKRKGAKKGGTPMRRQSREAAIPRGGEW